MVISEGHAISAAASLSSTIEQVSLTLAPLSFSPDVIECPSPSLFLLLTSLIELMKTSKTRVD